MSLKKLAPALIAAGVILCLCVAMGLSGPKQPPEQAPAVQESAVPEVPEAIPTEGEVQAEPQPEPQPEPEPAPEPEPEPLPVYDYTQPAPETAPVTNDYFADAAFVGDSRTDGFMIYSGIGTGRNLTSNGLSIFKLSTKKALTIGGEKYTLLEALAMEQHGKVYLCLGVNELGIYNDEGFYQSYLAAIDAIRAVQPGAVIYIQGLIPLNEEEIAASKGNTDLTNEHLRVYNDLMRRAAEEKQVVYLDLYTAFADENGSLPQGASRDGVHLTKEYCQQWLTYLQTHTVDPALLGLTQTDNEEDVSA